MRAMNKILRCLVLDDEPVATRLLASYIQQTAGLELVCHTTDINEAIEVIEREPIDLVFLDIEMPEMNGLEFMNLCKEESAVILTTAFREFAVEGFERDAVDYLLKPVTYERFGVAVNKARKRRMEPPVKADYLFVKVGARTQKINHETIFYLEALRDYVVFNTIEGKVMVSESLTAMEARLPKEQFTRIHRSFIISKAKVSFWEKWNVGINGAVLPIGDTYRERVLAELMDK